MCCLLAALLLIGPRAGILVWWLIDQARWMAAFSGSFLWPLLGFIFVPWTTLAWVLAWGPGRIEEDLGEIYSARHPARPPGYRPLDPFWRARGYAPLPGVVATFSWRDVGEPDETPKRLQFWARSL